MNARYLVLLFPLGLFLQGCAQQNSAAQQAQQAPPQSPPAGWSCAGGVTATRSNGSTAVYTGGDPQDPGYCLGTLDGSSNDGYLGIWDVDRGSAEIRAALGKLVAGPPGTEVQFIGTRGAAWSFKVLDRDDYTVGDRTAHAIHFTYIGPRIGQNEVWMDAHSGLYFRVRGKIASWQITSLKPS